MNMQNENAILLKPARFGKLIDASRAVVYRLIEEGTIHAVRVGGGLRIPASEAKRLEAAAIYPKEAA
jgi:excisionase family DNA binding protein